jgi:SpoVK/Ycf46/Vps4 family AAA+-type ATPase
VRVFEQDFALEDAIGSHACSLDANMRVTNGIPRGSPLLLPVGTVNYVETLKVAVNRALEIGGGGVANGDASGDAPLDNGDALDNGDVTLFGSGVDRSDGGRDGDVMAVAAESGGRAGNQNQARLKVGLAYKLTADDLRAGMREVRPSAMREILLDVPKVLWSDIGGHGALPSLSANTP